MDRTKVSVKWEGARSKVNAVCLGREGREMMLNETVWDNIGNVLHLDIHRGKATELNLPQNNRSMDTLYEIRKPNVRNLGFLLLHVTSESRGIVFKRTNAKNFLMC